MLRAPELALPLHAAAIVDLELLPTTEPEQWRLASIDADGWLRLWSDGRLLAAWLAHPEGVVGLAVAPDGTLYSAGFDGWVLEWSADATGPARALDRGRPISALAVGERHLALGGHESIELWTREPKPRLAWSKRPRGLITSLAVSPDGQVIAAASLHEQAVLDSLAGHPLARSVVDERVSAAELERLRLIAARDYPGATGDRVEVWIRHDRGPDRRVVFPTPLPIGADLGLTDESVIYREVLDRDYAWVVARSWTTYNYSPIDGGMWRAGHDSNSPLWQPDLFAYVGDYAIATDGDVVTVEQFLPQIEVGPQPGWRLGPDRTIAVGRGHVAFGDGDGNLAVIPALNSSEQNTWFLPGEHRVDLLAAAAEVPSLVTATIEPQIRYRLWSLAAAEHRSIRVDAPEWIVPPGADDPAAGAPLFPAMLAVDGHATRIASSLSSFSKPAHAGLQVIRVGDGQAQLLTLARAPNGLEIAFAPDSTRLLAWTPGSPTRSWTPPSATSGWSAGELSRTGAPRFSASGRWLALVDGDQRWIVDRSTGDVVVDVRSEQSTSGVALVAIADDGTLATVAPIGAGVLERISIAGTREHIELPGAATAIAWVGDRNGRSTLVVGFEDGTLARLDGDDLTPIAAGVGGRVWQLAPIGGRPGVFVELDDRGLMLRRLHDDETLELHAGDSPGPATHEQLVAIWRPGTALPACLLLDGSTAGVLAGDDVRRVGSSEAEYVLQRFLAGLPCDDPPAAPIEPVTRAARTPDPAAETRRG